MNTTREIVEIGASIVVGVIGLLASSHFTCRKRVENLLPVSRNHIDDNRLPLVQASADRQIDNNTQEVQLVPASPNVPPAQQLMEMDTRGKSAINGNGGTANYNQILKISVMVAGIIVIVIGLFTAYHFTCESGNVKGLFKPDPNGDNTQDDESVPARHLQKESHAKELMEMDIRGKSAINEIINTTREIMNITTEIIIRNSEEDKILKIVEIVVDIVVVVLELLGAVLAILAASHYTCRRLVENLLPVSRNHIDDNRLPLVQAYADRQIDNNTQEVQLVPASLNMPPAQQTQEVQLVPASPNVPPAHQTQEVQLVLASPNVPPAQQIKKVNPYSDSVSDDDTREGKESKKRHKPKKSDDEDEDDKKGKKRSDKSDIDEYAFAAGVTSIGVRGKDSVCVVTQKVVPDNLLDPTSVTHLFQVTKFLGLLATDTTADARQLVQQARNVAAKFRFNYGFEMPVDALARWIEGTSQVGVVTMVLGIDDGNGPKLFKCDPAGHFFGHKATSAGWKELEAINLLEKKMKNDPEFSYDETVQVLWE